MIGSECPCFVVVIENFGVSSPPDNGLQRSLRVTSTEMIFEFGLESHPRCRVALTLIEDMANVRGKRHKPQEVLLKKPLAFFYSALCEYAAAAVNLIEPSLSSANSRI